MYSKKTVLKIRFSFLFVRFLKPVFRFDIWVAKLSFSEQFFTFSNDSTFDRRSMIWTLFPRKISRLGLHKFRKKKKSNLVTTKRQICLFVTNKNLEVVNEYSTCFQTGNTTDNSMQTIWHYVRAWESKILFMSGKLLYHSS